MHGIGKKPAWNTWQNNPDFTRTFVTLLEHPSTLQLESASMKDLGCFTVLRYSRNCSAQSVNEARRVMFTHGLKSLESIPPTKHALYQHAKRSLLVSAFIWGKSLTKSPVVPDPPQ